MKGADFNTPRPNEKEPPRRTVLHLIMIFKGKIMLKFLVVEDDNQQTQVIYNSPEYLQQRHNITGCDQLLNKVSAALSGIVEAATE